MIYKINIFFYFMAFPSFPLGIILTSVSSNPQLNFSTSFLRVHILSLLNLQIIRTEIPTSAYNIPLPHNAT